MFETQELVAGEGVRFRGHFDGKTGAGSAFLKAKILSAALNGLQKFALQVYFRARYLIKRLGLASQTRS